MVTVLPLEGGLIVSKARMQRTDCSGHAFAQDIKAQGPDLGSQCRAQTWLVYFQGPQFDVVFITECCEIF